MQLVDATREKVKMKMLISSPTGFGKTYSALLMAYGITGDWSKIAVIDTENKSASLYTHLGKFKTIQMQPPYTIADFEKALAICVSAGMEVVIADSVTHYWDEVKSYVDRLGGTYQNWVKGTPMWAKFVTSILQSNVHIICTGRKKQAYEMTKDSNGKLKVEKKGMENQIRDGFDYEMTIVFELENDQHLAKAAKDRTGMFMDSPEFVITSETGKKILEWCESGAEPTPQAPKEQIYDEQNPRPTLTAAERKETAPTPPEKKPLSSENLQKLCKRITAGEIDLYEKAQESYSLTTVQLKILKDTAFPPQLQPAPEKMPSDELPI